MIASGLLAAGIPSLLVDETLDAFIEAKRRFHLGDHMPNAVEGGRFTESVLRIMEWEVNGGNWTPLGAAGFKADKLILQLESKSAFDDSVRFHIPRALRVIYGIRNKRDTAHLNDGIDPNRQDAALVMSTMSWVMAELVRKFHSVSAMDAEALIHSLVAWEVPIIEEYNGRPRMLKDLKASDMCLAFLYWAGPSGADTTSLRSWLPKKMQANALRTLASLHARHLVHLEGGHAQLTGLGQRFVATSDLISPI